MNIIPLLTEYLSSLFDAAEAFTEHPDQMDVLEKNVVADSLKMAAGFMALVLNETDDLIRESGSRKVKYNIQRRDTRTLITTAGDVTFNHTLFKDKESGKYSYLLDEMMRLPDHERFSTMAEVKVLNEAEVHSYQHAADSLSIGDQKVSKTAVMEKVHGIVNDLPEETAVPEEEKKWCDYLYIEADEDHIHRQKYDGEEKGCMIGKLIYVFEGKEDVCKDRRKLVGVHYHGGLYKGSDENRRLWEEVQKYIDEHYNTDVLKKVYICSDGGAWIKTGVDYIYKSVLVADRFHLMKYINRASNLMGEKSNETKGRFYKYIYKNKLLAVKKLLGRIRTKTGREDVTEDTKIYFENNWEAIQKAFHDKNALGCSAEGHVSNVYSERLSSRPMGWSETGSDRMCKLRCYVRNNGREKILDLVKFRRDLSFGIEEKSEIDDVVATMPSKHYSKAQKEAMSYAEKMYAPLGPTVKKILAIRNRISDI